MIVGNILVVAFADDGGKESAGRLSGGFVVAGGFLLLRERERAIVLGFSITAYRAAPCWGNTAWVR